VLFPMFSHQLKAETVPSVSNLASIPSLNDPDAARRLLEAHSGFAQFRVVLPGTVIWSAEAAKIGGRTPDQGEASLEETVLAYLPQDRQRIVDSISEAIAKRKGFHFTGRIRLSGEQVKVLETIGDVKVEAGEVTELYGLVRDVSSTIERDAMGISRARLIRHLVEDMPVPVVVLDRALRVVGCSTEWTKAYGVAGRTAALGKPLGQLVEVSRETTSAIIEALGGQPAHLGLWFYSGEDGRQVRRNCIVVPWQCGADSPGGVMIVIGGAQTSFASLEIADRALGRSTKGLLELLETL